MTMSMGKFLRSRRGLATALFLYTLTWGSFQVVEAVTFMPPSGGDCWNSTEELTLFELGILQSQNLTLLGQRRTYSFCPDSCIQVGFQRSRDSLQYDGGERPLIFAAPNVHIQCGPDGRSSNNCTIHGGSVQLNAGNVPPGFLPSGFVPAVDNLLVEGFTFEGFSRHPDLLGQAAIVLSFPGKNLVLSDCIFKNGIANLPIRSAVEAIYLDIYDIGPDVPSIQLMVKDCLFQNLVVGRAAIYGSVASSSVTVGNVTGPNAQYGEVEISVQKSLFYSIVTQDEGSMIAITDENLAFVSDSCFIGNTVDRGLYYAFNNASESTNNYAYNNTILDPAVDASGCSDFFSVSRVEMDDDGNVQVFITCQFFGGTTCAASLPPGVSAPPIVPSVSPTPIQQPPSGAASRFLLRGWALVLLLTGFAVLLC